MYSPRFPTPPPPPTYPSPTLPAAETQGAAYAVNITTVSTGRAAHILGGEESSASIDTDPRSTTKERRGRDGNKDNNE